MNTTDFFGATEAGADGFPAVGFLKSFIGVIDEHRIFLSRKVCRASARQNKGITAMLWRQIREDMSWSGTRIFATTFSTALVMFAVVGHAQTAQESSRPKLAGVWVAPSTSRNADWRLEDFLCNGAFCSIASLEYARALLDDPKNDDRPLKELSAEVGKYSRKQIADLLTKTAQQATVGFEQLDDPVNKCVPTGFNFAAGPLPIEMKQFDDRVELRYEFWSSVRTIYMDGRDHPPRLVPSRLGHSIGWYEGPTLVVETTGIEPHITYWAPGTRSSPHALVIERFTRSEDGKRLEIEKTFVDPVMLRRPLTTRESRLLSPDTEIMEYHCEPPEKVSR